MSTQRRSAPRRRNALRVLAACALALAVAAPAIGGGPMKIFNRQPVVYPNGGASLQLNVDRGPLGSRSNAQATQIVRNAIALWNGVSTSTLRIALGYSLPLDYTTANYQGIYGQWADGRNPVIFDSDGSLTDLLFGSGAKTYVLGFAGSAYYTSGSLAGRYAEGQAVLNGALSIDDATLTNALAHEIGHLIGLDHSQLDASQGLPTDDFVLMYPIAYRKLVSLHEDDVAAITALYPAANAGAFYGELNGAFTTAAGAPILGANIWARENSSGEVFSVVSDYLTQGNGYFRLLLPPGKYTLSAESIASSFTGSSSVGPYARYGGDLSFRSPHPITPVALGGDAPLAITIVAGCVATATFRLDGTGGITGNCGVTAEPTTTGLASSLNPATVGTSITLIATVTGNAPTGTVSFREGTSTLPGCAAVTVNGTGNSRSAICAIGSLAAGPHAIVATYNGDVANAPSSSATLAQQINLVPTQSGVNVALASAGAVASASSTLSGGYAVSGVIDDQRSGAGWGAGSGGWKDATGGLFPDWVQVSFDSRRTIDRVVVYTLQDNLTNPVEPTDTLTFTRYGITSFSVQTWNGSSWLTQAIVTGNNRVKRTVFFNPVTTDRIRINVNGAIDGYSRITEIEAWATASSAQTVPTTTALASSVNPADAGTTVTFTATVTGNAPTGTVNFNDGAASIAGCSAIALAGSGNSRTATCGTGALAVGTHSITATYSGNGGNVASTSAPLSQQIASASTESVNVALASAGAVATVSSGGGSSYPASALINNQRSGAGWGQGTGGWKDSTGNVFPDWLQIAFNGPKTIDRVVLYSMQDNYLNPVEPTDAMTCTRFCVTAFSVDTWNGSAWVTQATVTGSNLIKRSVAFAPVTTDRIRINITGSRDAFTRVVEVEAWGK